MNDTGRDGALEPGGMVIAVIGNRIRTRASCLVRFGDIA